jgi:hypothetical protein
MGKKPFVLIAIGVLMIIAGLSPGASEPTCGRGTTMSPGEVCVDTVTGEEETYEEMKERGGGPAMLAIPIGVVIILCGGFVMVKRLRNPGWRTAGTQVTDQAQAQAQAQSQPHLAAPGHAPYPQAPQGQAQAYPPGPHGQAQYQVQPPVPGQQQRNDPPHYGQ